MKGRVTFIIMMQHDADGDDDVLLVNPDHIEATQAN